LVKSAAGFGDTVKSFKDNSRVLKLGDVPSHWKQASKQNKKAALAVGTTKVRLMLPEPSSTPQLSVAMSGQIVSVDLRYPNGLALRKRGQSAPAVVPETDAASTT
jgi:cell division septal protein FtsQ